MDKIPLKLDEINKRIPGNNKADSLLNLWRWKIPYDLQVFAREFIKEYRAKTDKVDIEEIFKGVYKDNTLGKDDPRFANFKAFYTKVIRNTDSIPFTDDQIHQIITRGGFRSPRELAFDIFPELQHGTNQDLNKYSVNIKNIVDAFGVTYNGPKGEANAPKVTDSDYIYPVNDDETLKKLKEHVPLFGWAKNTLDAPQRRCLRALQAQLCSVRFLRTINGMVDVNLRRMFEQEFIRLIYDKPDLTAEDINICITICELFVDSARISERIHIMESDFKKCADGDDEKFGFEFRQKLTKEINETSRQREDTKDSLKDWLRIFTQSQEKRLNQRLEQAQSMFKYVLDFTDERKREKALQSAEARNREVLAQMAEVEGYDGVAKGEINGISQDEIFAYRFVPQ